MNTRKLKRATARGAKLLDRNLPTWFKTTQISKLDMGRATRTPQGCGCVLAQQYGNYGEGLDQLDIDDPHELGFDYDQSPAEYPALTSAWKDEIRKRRAA